MSSKTTWGIRALQLDLARQKETLQTIEFFIRFAKDWGYNVVFLYLEGIIQTPSFPYRKTQDSYTIEEIQTILKIAEEVGIEIVPGLATLGHAEHFLDCPELRHLAETNFWYKHMLCPSHPETHPFLEAYLTDMANLFPSRNFHIGGDEAWALGACPVCQERIRKGEKREDIYLAHISKVYQFLKPFGKKIWLWPDLFETFSKEALSKLPKDMTLCSWHYTADQITRDGIQGHFNNLRRRDMLSEQSELGFDTLICPWGKEINSGITLTQAAEGKGVVGGLLTNWEMDDVFLPGILPPAAVIGHLWSQPDATPEQALQVMFEKLFPNAGELEKISLHQMLLGSVWETTSFLQILHRGSLNFHEKHFLNTAQSVAYVLENYLNRLEASPPCLEFDIVEEFLMKTRLQIANWKLRANLADIIDPRIAPDVTNSRARAIRQEVQYLQEVRNTRSRQWQRYRPGIEPDTASAAIEQLCVKTENFLTQWTQAPTHEKGLLTLRLFLLESYSAPILNLAFLESETDRWIPLPTQTIKPVNLKEASYSIQIPFFWKATPPSTLQLSVSGYGGQGVQFVQYVLGNQRYTPKKVTVKEGRVENPDALLEDNAFLCFLGEKDTLKTLETFTHNQKNLAFLDFCS